MTDHRHYLPILKGKAGEFDALAHLSPGVKPQLTPLIEVPPIETKYSGPLGNSAGPKSTIDQHVSQVPQNILKAWGTELPVLIDCVQLEQYGSLANGTHPLTYNLDECRNLGVQAIPVTCVARSNEYQNAVIGALQRDGRGVCIRADRNECGCPTSLVRQLHELIMTAKVKREEVELIFDLGAIDGQNLGELPRVASLMISELPCVEDWRTLAVAATAMPQSVTRDMERLSIKRIPRAERTLWCAVVGDSDLPRIPSFSDYGVTHPEYVDLDWREVSLAGKIRYTAHELWVIVKGLKLEGQGDQFHKLADMLVKQPEFRFGHFSWGDESIEKCANLEIGPGTLTTWLAYTTNHHLRFVTEELANGL